MTNLNEKIRSHRERHGLSQEQLAGLLGVSPHDVAHWEHGELTPDVAQIMRLSDIFGVTMDYLLKSDETDAQDVRSNDSAGHSRTIPRGSGTGRSHVEINLGRHKKKHREKNIIISNIYNIALVAFLVLGLGFGMWHPGWMVFVLAWVVADIRSIRFSIYSVALIIFLVLGFFFSEWRWAWIVFPVAWLVSNLANDHRKNTTGRGFIEEDDDE